MKQIGRYDIIEELGRGAMGVVYKASDPTIGRIVAIKVLSLGPSLGVEKSRALELFMREARAAGRLSHPGLVTIYDAVEDAKAKASYIVMEFIRGQTLEKALASGRHFDTTRALEIAHQIAEALDYAHSRNVIHRDLKPANILLTDDDRVKITDFGIAKFKGRVGSVHTDAILGTPSHMSPEQVTGGEVDDRSDLFALGIILYTMLTGEQPFKGDVATVMFKIVHKEPAAPSHLNPELAPAHDQIVSRCLAKDRNKRYSSARKFLDDLERIHQGRPPRSETRFSLSELRILGANVVARVPPIGTLLNWNVKGKTKKGALLVADLVLFALLVWRIAGHDHRKFSNVPSPPTRTTAASQPAPVTTVGTTQLPSVPNPPSGPSPSTLQPTQLATASAQGKKDAGAATSPALAPKRASAARGLHSPTNSASAPAVPRTAPRERVVRLVCRHTLQQATLTISSGPKVLFTASLRGKKKAAFLGIKGGYEGVLSRPLSIPAEIQELSVRILSADGSVDLTNTISATSGAGPSAALYVAVDGPNLALNWRMIRPRAPSPPTQK